MALPGDDLVPDAVMVFNTKLTITATPEDVWPWLVQLGKNRAGWYFPRGVERFIPVQRRAIRQIEPRWQGLTAGDRVPDYGGSDEFLEVAWIEQPRGSSIARSAGAPCSAGPCCSSRSTATGPASTFASGAGSGAPACVDGRSSPEAGSSTALPVS